MVSWLHESWMAMKVYIAGKVSKESVFNTHHWRDDFCGKLTTLSGIELTNLDPMKVLEDLGDSFAIFKKDCQLINQADIFIVYLTDDISVGGSQEILIAKYLHKPVIGFAPYGGKFNGATREMHGKVITDYKDPFVFSTCDMVCGTLEEVADALKTITTITPKTLSIIDEALR
jgi:nucleoside 2-deoxyribosyltransferase